MTIDSDSGPITGRAPAKSGEFAVRITVTNSVGRATCDLRIIVDDTICLTLYPPHPRAVGEVGLDGPGKRTTIS